MKVNIMNQDDCIFAKSHCIGLIFGKHYEPSLLYVCKISLHWVDICFPLGWYSAMIYFSYSTIYPSLHNFLAKILCPCFLSIPLVSKPSLLRLPRTIFIATHKTIRFLCYGSLSHVFTVWRLCKKIPFHRSPMGPRVWLPLSEKMNTNMLSWNPTS